MYHADRSVEGNLKCRLVSRPEDFSLGFPSSLTTMEMMKKLRATMAMLSRHVRPRATTDAPNCHVAALKASEIQYAMKLVTPHFGASGGTGSRSLLVLEFSVRLALPLSYESTFGAKETYHLALPSAKQDSVCSTCRRGLLKFMPLILDLTRGVLRFTVLESDTRSWHHRSVFMITLRGARTKRAVGLNIQFCSSRIYAPGYSSKPPPCCYRESSRVALDN